MYLYLYLHLYSAGPIRPTSASVVEESVQPELSSAARMGLDKIFLNINHSLEVAKKLKFFHFKWVFRRTSIENQNYSESVCPTTDGKTPVQLNQAMRS